MRIPEEAIIPPEKLSNYLLKVRPWDDKSKFLAQAGLSSDAPEKLEDAIRAMAAAYDAVEDGSNSYGVFYRVVGLLEGSDGTSLLVAQIWLQWISDSAFHFVTLKPVPTKK